MLKFDFFLAQGIFGFIATSTFFFVNDVLKIKSDGWG